MDLPHHDIELSLSDSDQCEESARTLLKKVKRWDPSQIKFEVYTVGITNKIFSAYVDPCDRVIVRVFGQNTDKIINRKHELVAWDKLSLEGLAAPLLATFTNGIVCGYLHGKSTTVEQVKNHRIAIEIARAIAKMHNIDRDSQIPKSACLFDKLNDFYRNLKEFDDETKKEAFEKHFPVPLRTEINNLKTKIEELDEKVVFCHNDLLVHNIIWNSETGQISLIDYEYADSNYALFDIANHFCEYAGTDNPDYSLCPTKDEKKVFIYDYLKFREGIVDDGKMTTMLQRIPLFEAAAHLFWAVWALVQSQNSTISFDYFGYAQIRYEMYNRRLKKYDMNAL